jgi:hypothetical protein
MDAKAAIRVILSDEANFDGTLNYAVNYCRAALELEGYDFRVQCNYILSNITRWRHPQAKAVRDALKAAAKG